MTKTRAKTKRGLGRFLFYLLMILLLAILLGFLAFARHVSKLSPPAQIESADGIVVWTGKGGDRLQSAGDLLNQGVGERLFISGVNKALSQEDVFALLSVDSEKGTCCVDLDYEAEDTIGNARETQHWIKSLGYEHIILVTSDYHMPRASAEIRNRISRVRITPYPVREVNAKPWWKDSVQRRRMFREYGKLLLSHLRNSGGEARRSAPELTDMPETD